MGDLANDRNDPEVGRFVRSAAPVLGVLLLAGVVGLVTTAARLIVAPGFKAPLDRPAGGIVLLAAGLGITVIAGRLLGGERRQDGGILPPWLIRAGAVLFLFAPVILFQVTGNVHLVMASSAVWAAIAASGFRVIRQRRDRVRP